MHWHLSSDMFVSRSLILQSLFCWLEFNQKLFPLCPPFLGKRVNLPITWGTMVLPPQGAGHGKRILRTIKAKDLQLLLFFLTKDFQRG